MAQTNVKHAPTKATRLAVKLCASAGVEQKIIALRIGVSEPTLRKHYRAELDFGAQMVTGDLMESLYKMAMSKKDSPAKITAIIWAQKNISKWSDRIGHQHTGADGASLPGATNNINMQLYIPDNGRDPHLFAAPSAPPMKVIEGVPVKELPSPSKAKESP